MVMGMLVSEDTLRQQTAANMAGFWISEPDMEKVGMELLSRLGEKLGMPGKVAEGAANSFKALAIAWKEKDTSPLLKVYVSRSGRGRVGGGEPVRESSNSEAAGRGGSESSHTVANPEGGGGHGHSDSEGGDDGHKSSATGSVSGGPGGGADQSICTSGRGGYNGKSRSVVPNISARNAVSRSGASNARGDDELKWNVVHKMVDLVANKRLPTLQVYVRALDSFFMSESVKKWLATKERRMYENQLQSIINGGDSNRASENPGHTSVTIDSSTKARTRLLSFSALDRLNSEVDGIDLLQKVDRHLNEVQEKFVIWIDEVTRYDELCEKYRYGDWRKPGSNWEVRGGVFPPLPELEES